jgi:hypothetical protein
MPQKASTSPLKHLWKSLESLPTLQAVKEEWKTLLKEEFSSVEPLLTPCGDLATSFPRRGRSRMGLPLRVVQHGDDDFVAVCDETGDRHAISRDDLIVYRFDAPRFISIVARMLRLTPVRQNTTMAVPAMMVGVCNATVGLGSTVFLSFECSSRGLESSILTLMSTQNQKFFLFTPTEQFWSSRVISLMQSRQSDLFSLQASFWASASGEWTAVEHLIQHLNPAVGENCDPRMQGRQNVGDSHLLPNSVGTADPAVSIATPIIDKNTFTVLHAGKSCELRNTKEFAIFERLHRRIGQYFSVDTLVADVWRDELIEKNTVQKTIGRLRRKLQEAGCDQIEIDGTTNAGHYAMKLRG